MKAVYKTTNPDEIELTLSLTMTLRGWKRLRNQLESMSYPSSNLNQKIREMIDLAEYELEQEIGENK